MRIVTKEKMEEFEALARPMIEFLNENFHPHVEVRITPDSAAISSGECFIPIKDYIKDRGD